MAQQIEVGPDARAGDEAGDEGLREVAFDIAYRRLMIANIVFLGPPDAGDRGWVLVDAGFGPRASAIRDAAEARFGRGARPRAIVLTHGHFDHVGALETLAEEWDVPVWAHRLERPYLTGAASYPSGDPSVGGGLMATLSPLYPTAPVNVGERLHDLPEDGSIPDLPGWRWIFTPGHSVGHISLWREADRVLIAGDAVITTAQESAYAAALQVPELHGPPRYLTVDWDLATRSVADLAALEPNLLVSGHGRALEGAPLRTGLHELSARFGEVAVPRQGRYVERPARAEDGSAYHRL